MKFRVIRRGPLDAFVEIGGKAMNSVAEVANSTNVILTCLPDAGALGEVSSGEGGIVANPQDGLVLFEMSIMEPEAKVFDYFPVCYQKLNIFLITLS